MRYFFCLLLVAVLWLNASGQVNTAEYFLDSDPGIGKGTAVAVSAGTDVTFKFNIPLSNVTAGVHNLFVRVRDAQGHWSVTSAQSFLCNDLLIKSTSVTKAEYFLDNDPGINHGTPVAINSGSDVTVKFNVPLTNLTAGVHVLYARVLDNQGRWSVTSAQSFLTNDIFIKNTAVEKAEYFLDTEPGIGSGTAIALSPGATVTTKFNVPLSNVSPGVHQLYVRAMDNRGHWSVTSQQTFYVNALDIKNRVLASAEYFIDTDPGPGKGTVVKFPAGQTNAQLGFSVDVKKLTNGVHTLNVRVLDDKGSWSLTDQQVFFVSSATLQNITAIQYQFSNPNFTSQVYSYAVPTPATSVDLNFKENLTDLPVDQAYTMSIYAINAGGLRSPAQTRTVKVCSGIVPSAAFDLVQDGTIVNFVAKDTAKVNYKWNFGDGQTDSIGTVLHNYDKPGAYNVKLIVSNFCYSDTLSKTINVLGLSSIVANNGGNTGQVTATINGSGFDSKSTFSLQGAGGVVPTTNVVINNSSSATATFDLTGKAVGTYNVIAVLGNGQMDTLKNSFTVENGNIPKLSVSLSGDYVIRIGFNQIYTASYTNYGNVDATLVPIMISGLPAWTNIEVVEPTFKLSSVPGFENTAAFLDTLNHTMYDSTTNTSFRILYINSIPAGSNGSLHFIFHIPVTTQLHSFPDVKITIGSGVVNTPPVSPVNNGPDNIQSNLTNAADAETPGLKQYFDCGASILSLAGTALKGVATVVYEAEIKDWVNCALDVGSTLETVGKFYLQNTQGKSHEPMDWVDLSYGGITTIKDCAQAALGVAFPESKIVAIVKAASKYSEKAFAAADIGVAAGDAFKTCGEAFFPNALQHFEAIIGNAWDPNDKYGPGDASASHFTNNRTLNYVVNFENEPTANLNAQTVTVLDTISQALDIKTFGFTSVTLGDSIYTFPPVKSFIHDFDLSSKYGVKARVAAKFDTLSGVAQWKFFSIDPKTNQVITDALAGFLPPDQNSPEGQGYLGYQVGIKSTAQTGDVVNNQAFITFDYNPVIPTKVWTNTFDFVPPTSKMDALPASVSDSTFKVSWSGTDNLSGAGYYNIYYAINKGPFQSWLNNTSVTTALFPGQKDSTYSFYSIAIDNAGNIEADKTAAETSTTVSVKTAQTITFPAFAVKTYGDADFAPGASASSGLAVTYKSSDTTIAKISNANIHIVAAGTGKITALQSGNDTYGADSVTNVLTIQRAPLTVKAKDTSRIAGQSNPSFLIDYSGFVNGDDSTRLTSLPIAKTTAGKSSPAGQYAITVGGGTSANYTITYVPGILTVKPIPAPTISSFVPTDAKTGTTITITGTNLDNATALKFGDTPAQSFTINSSESITAVVGSGASGSVSATTAGGTASLAGFNFVFDLPNNNFSVSAISATCRGATDGSIQIAAIEKMNYTASISGNGVNASYSFTTTQTIGNLTAGTYHVCITVQGQPDYQQCYDLTVSEPQDLSVYATVNQSNQNVTLALSGGTSYTIQLNDATYVTTGSQITLPLQPGDNHLSVVTDKLCQGSFQTIINLLRSIIPFPDPFQNVLNINLGSTKVSDAYFEVHDAVNGKTVYSKDFKNQSGTIQLDLSSLHDGVYALHIKLDNSEQVFKIIKR